MPVSYAELLLEQLEQQKPRRPGRGTFGEVGKDILSAILVPGALESRRKQISAIEELKTNILKDLLEEEQAKRKAETLARGGYIEKYAEQLGIPEKRIRVEGPPTKEGVYPEAVTRPERQLTVEEQWKGARTGELPEGTEILPKREKMTEYQKRSLAIREHGNRLRQSALANVSLRDAVRTYGVAKNQYSESLSDADEQGMNSAAENVMKIYNGLYPTTPLQTYEEIDEVVTKSGFLGIPYEQKKTIVVPKGHQQKKAVNIEPIDQQALNWANANPKDSRAIKIKQRLSTKYGKQF